MRKSRRKPTFYRSNKPKFIVNPLSHIAFSAFHGSLMQKQIKLKVLKA